MSYTNMNQPLVYMQPAGGDVNPVDPVRYSINEGILKSGTFLNAYNSGSAARAYGNSTFDYGKLMMEKAAFLPKSDKPLGKLDDIKDLVMFNPLLLRTQEFLPDKSLYLLPSATRSNLESSCGYRC